MIRNIDINEISDGKLYTANDMVKADCHDCKGCSDCCRGMGSSILLDPMDIWRLSHCLQMSFEEMLDKHIELGMVDGMILPNLKMTEGTDACSFLNEEGRCRIHPYRPGICRLFPLGRIYEENGFKYFLQIDECAKSDLTKVKVKKWIDMPNLKNYEKYIDDWHGFIMQCSGATKTLSEQEQRTLTLYVLRAFFQTAYESEEFYEEFYGRLKNVKEMFGF